MESTSSHEAGLMAAWRATGGASDAMRETAAEDEGMAAFGISRSVLYCGDDGLAATQYSDPYRCNIDDGLVARAPSFGGNDCRADDGLEAARPTREFYYCGDDGLAATQYSDPYRCNIDDGLVARAPSFGGNDCRADDGLEAGGHYTSFGCLLNDDGLQATGPTQSWNRCF